MSDKKRATESNVSKVPNQSGVYILHRGPKSKYVGSAGAGRLQGRIEQQLDQKRGITSFQYRPTSSEAEAKRLEKQYRDRINPEQKRV
jgi:excinuclease UvrABC nuclease subunit